MVTLSCCVVLVIASMGGDLAPSLGGRNNFFADQIFERPFFLFLGKIFLFNAEKISDDFFYITLFS